MYTRVSKPRKLVFSCSPGGSCCKHITPTNMRPHRHRLQTRGTVVNSALPCLVGDRAARVRTACYAALSTAVDFVDTTSYCWYYIAAWQKQGTTTCIHGPPRRRCRVFFACSASRFGAVLDMVTDRCSTAGLLLVLSRLYGRRHAFAFLVLMFVDLFSHWMHTHRRGETEKTTYSSKSRSCHFFVFFVI